jgi:hypothetical protein
MSVVRIILVLIALSFPVSALAETRIALVIGIGAYTAVEPLVNPTNDAKQIADRLEQAGFAVTLLVDAGRAEMTEAIGRFGRDLRNAGPEATGLFFYAGHGVQSFGQNFLLPVDIALTNAADLGLVAVPADTVLRQMASARNRTNIVILDACRNNPFTSIPDLGDNGLAEMKAPTGTFLAFSTAPGSIALDGKGSNSPFTEALIGRIPTPGLPIEQLFKQVRNSVIEQTGGQQTPWDTSSLTWEFSFFPAEQVSAEDIAAKQLWDVVSATNDPVQIMLFLRSYPNSRYANEARTALAAAMEKTTDPGSGSASAGPSPQPGDQGFRTAATEPAVRRGEKFMGTPEGFNRYYTDPSWAPSRVLWTAPTGSGDGSSSATPMSVKAALEAVRPGTMIRFAAGQYDEACFEMNEAQSGTYDDPVVLYGERGPDGALGVSMTCCEAGRGACFNLEAANHVVIDGFDMAGGRFGVRAVGAGYAATEHARGIAVLSSRGRGQKSNPFFSGQVDWAVWEGNEGSGAGEDDGHGLYLSNGGDWNIVRRNTLFGNASSDFQVNADPAMTCREDGIAFDDPLCDAIAGTGEGGRGASDFFLIEQNAFHHGRAPSGVGANFTSVRLSVIRNNIFGFQPRHGVSFWQETDNPRLGSRGNKVLHNLFVTTGRGAVQFLNHSGENEFSGNLLIGVKISGDRVIANRNAILLQVDETVADNTYRGNFYAGGTLVGRKAGDSERSTPQFKPEWFADFPTARFDDPSILRPAAAAPFASFTERHADAPTDFAGRERIERTASGPFEP